MRFVSVKIKIYSYTIKMKINTDNIQESIQKSRPTLKTNTVKQYEINLNKLKKIFDTDSYDFLEKPKTVMDKISHLHYTSQRNHLNAIIVLLSALNTNEKYDKLYLAAEKRRDKFLAQYKESMEKETAR